MLDAERIEAAITPRTKAVVPVHFAGACVDLDPIRQLAERHGIPVIEDAAHAPGPRYGGRWIGETGTAIFSFHPIKNLPPAAKAVWSAPTTRRSPTAFAACNSMAWAWTPTTAESQGRTPQAEVIEPGYKYNLTDINAALGLGQLDRLAEMNAAPRGARRPLPNVAGGHAVQPLTVPAYPSSTPGICSSFAWTRPHAASTRSSSWQRLQAQNIGTGLHFLRGSPTEILPRERLQRRQPAEHRMEFGAPGRCRCFPDMTTDRRRSRGEPL